MGLLIQTMSVKLQLLYRMSPSSSLSTRIRFHLQKHQNTVICVPSLVPTAACEKRHTWRRHQARSVVVGRAGVLGEILSVITRPFKEGVI